jgi:PKD repeat protein
MSANPTQISTTGTSTITIQALRSNGNPVNPGTEIRLSTTIGRIDPVVYTDDDGVARAQLKGTGRAGTATVTAHSGAVEPVTVDITVGTPAAAIRLTASPTSVPETGGTVALLALVRDDQGQPLPGVSVNFSSEAGTLESGGEFVETDASGTARDVLTVTALDLQAVGDDSFEVTAEVGGVGGVQTDTFEVGIQRPPRASFTTEINGQTVAFTDTSTGNPTSWHWDFGDGNESTQQNPVHTYVGTGPFTVIFTARNSVGESVASTTLSFP